MANKITLRQLVNKQVITGEEDSALIAQWFEMNDMALEGLDIIWKLARNKITNDEWKYGCLLGDLSMYGATEELIKAFGVKDGLNLDHIMREWIICDRVGDVPFDVKYPQHIEWLKSIIPTKKQPFIFWQPFIKWMNEHDIYFKDQKGETK